MAKSRLAPPLPSPRGHTHRATLTGGNGSPTDGQETSVQRLERIEAMLERMQQTLDTQFHRMADIQVVLDRLTAAERRLL